MQRDPPKPPHDDHGHDHGDYGHDHNHGHEHHHDHDHAQHPHLPHSHVGGDTRRSRVRLAATMAVTATIMMAEVAGGLYSGSLALLADAGHMLTDLLSLLVAFAAMVWGARPADARRTYGYRRLEVLAALANSVALVLVAGSIAWEAWQRLKDPASVALPVMMGVAAVGLAANLVGLWLMGHGHDHDNVNMRGAFLHILGDTLSSLGVIVGGAIMATTGWLWIDPLLSVALAVLIVASSYRLLKEVIDVLLEAVPRGIDAEAVHRAMHQVPGVDQVHDLHIWSITSGMAALSAHVVVTDSAQDPNVVLHDSLALLREKFHIDHATLQIERSVEPACGCAHNNAGVNLPR